MSKGPGSSVISVFLMVSGSIDLLMTARITEAKAGMKIKLAHPDLKGSFTCLGNWYNLHSDESMRDLSETLSHVPPGDRKTARREIAEAKKKADRWERDPLLDFLYKDANAQGSWSVKF